MSRVSPSPMRVIVSGTAQLRNPVGPDRVVECIRDIRARIHKSAVKVKDKKSDGHAIIY